jgi:hypothetical protein
LVARLEYINVAERAGDPRLRLVARFEDGGLGHEVLRAEGLVYCPASRCSIALGGVPGEIIDHDEHFRQAADGYARRRGLLSRRREIAESAEEVCILGNPHSHVFFHWLGELLKVAAFERAGFPGKYVLTPDMPSFCAEYLGLLGIAGDRILRPAAETRFAAGWVCGHLNLFTVGDHPGALMHLRGLLADAVGDDPGRGERLWIDRRGVSRGVVNAEEIAPLLAQAGFTVVDMAELSPRQQVAAALHARIIAGPHGSGLAHAALMGQGGALIEAFSPLHLYPCLLEVCRVLGHDYRMLAGSNAPWAGYAHGSAVHVEPAQLRAALGRI